MASAGAGEIESGSPVKKSVEDADVVVIELQAPEGWKKKFTPKKAGSAGRREIIFVAPTGEEIKSKRQLEQYLRAHPGGPPSSKFDWGTGDTPRRSARISEKAKATESPETERPKKRERRSSLNKESKDKKDGGDKEDETATEAPETENDSKTQQEKPAAEDTEAAEDQDPADTETKDAEKPVEDVKEETDDIKIKDAADPDSADKSKEDVEEKPETKEAPQVALETEKKSEKENPDEGTGTIAIIPDTKENKPADDEIKDGAKLPEIGDNKDDHRDAVTKESQEHLPPSSNCEDGQQHPSEDS
ncbi:hypothetical protein J5N97_010876 [Dioscorea zingiberensis]|uniref:MBD domain-containing protein n=1 Tax=Dioscorea zingiberensis TaxID=325984 RepID=A0A9D5HN70_9LILI|nr:hypothetical protein J5N97_010876 [Dioscorea zingiberensis]